jgi:hypothetical protein
VPLACITGHIPRDHDSPLTVLSVTLLLLNATRMLDREYVVVAPHRHPFDQRRGLVAGKGADETDEYKRCLGRPRV